MTMKNENIAIFGDIFIRKMVTCKKEVNETISDCWSQQYL